VTKIRTVEAIAIEKFFVPGKWLPSLRKSIYFLLMTSSNRESIVSLFYRFNPGTFLFTCPGRLIVFLCLCKLVIIIGYTFDKLDVLDHVVIDANGLSLMPMV
jgi:hypothetical protein